jgi:two-component system, chemotaxis family, protein-glutamate methylesterase/glutaminase
MTHTGAEPRVLVCDESKAYATSLAQFLEVGDQLSVVGVCGTGGEALQAVPRLAPDLVTMNLEPSRDRGLRLIAEIMHSHPVPILVLSEGARRGSAEAADALAAGAVDALPKSQLRLDDATGPAAVALRHRLRRLARAGVEGGNATRPQARPGPPDKHASVVAICASTGGPRALEVVLGGLPSDFPLPVLVVQHISAGFMDGLLRWLGPRLRLPVGVADDGQEVRSGIWFPPDDAHLLLRQSMRVELDRETVIGQHRPSGDLLLQSVADAAGGGAVGVVLTGMGKDGAAGAAAILAAGGKVIAQDEQTSVVYGMPRAAAGAGASAVLPLEAIAGALQALAPVGAER